MNKKCNRCGKQMFITGGCACCFDCFYKVKLEPQKDVEGKCEIHNMVGYKCVNCGESIITTTISEPKQWEESKLMENPIVSFDVNKKELKINLEYFFQIQRTDLIKEMEGMKKPKDWLINKDVKENDILLLVAEKSVEIYNQAIDEVLKKLSK